MLLVGFVEISSQSLTTTGIILTLGVCAGTAVQSLRFYNFYSVLMKDSIVVDGVTYVPESTTCATMHKPSSKRIVILQRGWIYVGDYAEDGMDCTLSNASCIRTWGTTKGLGELASDGPNSNTKLDPCNGIVEFDYLTVVATISCDEKKWEKELK